MLKLLKPSKTSVLGTAALMIAKCMGDALPRLFVQLLGGAGGGMAGAAEGVQMGGMAPPGQAGMAGGGMAGSLGSTALGWVVLAILFYIIVSLIISKSMKNDAAGA